MHVMFPYLLLNCVRCVVVGCFSVLLSRTVGTLIRPNYSYCGLRRRFVFIRLASQSRAKYSRILTVIYMLLNYAHP